MALETAVGQKLITEDGLNGLPVRIVDANGKPLNNTSRQLLHASAAETTNWNSGPIDTSSLRQFIAVFTCTALSGTSPTWQPFIQFSDDGGTTWYNLIIPGAFSSTGQVFFPVGPGDTGSIGGGSLQGQGLAVPVPDTIRLLVNLGGTTPSATFKATLLGQ